jgi:hypothetical protein
MKLPSFPASTLALLSRAKASERHRYAGDVRAVVGDVVGTSTHSAMAKP